MRGREVAENRIYRKTTDSGTILMEIWLAEDKIKFFLHLTEQQIL